LRKNSHETLFGLAPGGVYPATNCYQWSGALLPHPFSLTCSAKKAVIGGLLSAALVVGLRRPGVTWHPVHWSPDFPPLYTYTYHLHNKHYYKAAIVWSTRGAFYSKTQLSPRVMYGVYTHHTSRCRFSSLGVMGISSLI